jgi:hypothetical protein
MGKRRNGLTKADRKALADFQRKMNEEVIPEIVEAVYRRQQLAAESRKWQLRV